MPATRLASASRRGHFGRCICWFLSEDRVICTVRPGLISNHRGVKLTPLSLVLVPLTASADPGWRIDVSARGVASVELDSGAMQMREAVVPAFGARFEHRVGAFYLGGGFTAGFPGWYGRTEAALSVDHERVLAKPTCEVVSNDWIGEQHCHGARWSLAIGADAGVGLLYFDAPPETPAISDAVIYWGPLARARVQLHVLDLVAGARAVGLVLGVNLAVTSARYMSPSAGNGIRLEPEIELGVTMRL
jgi:hypothetical protein